MNRRQARELAFVLLFEQTFSPTSTIRELLENAGEARDVQQDDFAVELAEGAVQNLQVIDQKITEFSLKWSKDRLSRVSLAVMRLAVYEMLYREDIPVSVSINEAVELAKKYAGTEDAAFINGVLGGIVRAQSV